MKDKIKAMVEEVDRKVNKSSAVTACTPAYMTLRDEGGYVYLTRCFREEQKQLF